MFENWFKRRTVVVPRISRTADQQRAMDALTVGLTLYHFHSCAFCARVRQVIRSLSLNVELRDIRLTPAHYRDLVMQGGRPSVPCLRIESPGLTQPRWMYESRDIITYLIVEFGNAA